MRWGVGEGGDVSWENEGNRRASPTRALSSHTAQLTAAYSRSSTGRLAGAGAVAAPPSPPPASPPSPGVPPLLAAGTAGLRAALTAGRKVSPLTAASRVSSSRRARASASRHRRSPALAAGARVAPANGDCDGEPPGEGAASAAGPPLRWCGDSSVGLNVQSGSVGPAVVRRRFVCEGHGMGEDVDGMMMDGVSQGPPAGVKRGYLPNASALVTHLRRHAG